MSKSWLSLLVVALLGVGFYGLWRLVSLPAEPLVEDVGAGAGAGDPSQPRVTDGPRAAVTAPRENGASERGHERGEGAPKPLQPRPPLRGGLELQLVDHDGEPLAGEAIVVQRPRTLPQGEWARRLRDTAHDPRDLALRYGALYVPGPDGRLLVPEPAAPQLAYLRAGEHWSLQTISPLTTSPHTVALHPSRAITVQVVDEQGELQADLPVVLRQFDANHVRDFWVGASGSDGRLRIEHVDQLLAREAHLGGVFQVALGFPTARPVGQPVDPEDLPTHILQLVAPATGSLNVRVRDVAGRPVQNEVEVEVSTRTGGVFDEGRGRIRFTRTAQGGVGDVRFEHVGIGATLHVRAQAGGGRPFIETVPGPTKSGETKSLLITFGDKFPVFVGTVLGPGGEALIAADVRLTLTTIHPDGREIPRARLDRTDTEGRFYIVDAQELPAGARRRLTVYAGHGEALNTPRVEADVTSLREVRQHELGDLQPLPPPLLARGVVVDERGEGVAGATIQVERGYVLGGAEQQVAWVPDPRLSTTTDTAGGFTLRAFDVEVSAGQLRVVAALEGYQCVAPQPMGEDVRLVLSSGVELRGSVVLDPEALVRGRDSLAVELRAPAAGDDGGALATAERMFAEVQDDGSFAWTDVPPGEYEVRIGTLVEDDPVRRVRVQVTPGTSGMHPDLERLDLREELELLTLILTAPRGAVAENAVCYVGSEPAGARIHRGVEVRDGERSFLVRAGLADLWIHAEEYRPERIEGAEGRVEVPLRPALPVEVRVQDGLPGLEEGLDLCARLVPTGPATEPASLFIVTSAPGRRTTRETPGREPAFVTLNTEDRVLLRVPEPGKYVLEWELVRKRLRATERRPVPQPYPLELEIDDTDALQAFRVPVHPDDLAKAISAFHP